jgi:hypothetical protein
MKELSTDDQPAVSKATTAVEPAMLCSMPPPPTYVLGCFAGAALLSRLPRKSIVRLSAVARGAPHTPSVMLEGGKFCTSKTS